MNNNLLKYIKKISICTLVFIFCFMIGNSEVKAYDICTYKKDSLTYQGEAWICHGFLCVNGKTEYFGVTKTEIVIAVEYYGDGDYKVTCTDGRSSSRGNTHPSDSDCGAKDKVPSLFVVEDGKLYCPTKLYANVYSHGSDLLSAWADFELSDTKGTSYVISGQTDYTFPSKDCPPQDKQATEGARGCYATSGSPGFYLPRTSGNKFLACERGGLAKISETRSVLLSMLTEVRKLEDSPEIGEKIAEYNTLLKDEKYKPERLHKYCYFNRDEAKKQYDNDDQNNPGILQIVAEILRILSEKNNNSENIAPDQQEENNANIWAHQATLKDMSISGNYDTNKEYSCTDYIDDDLKAVIQKLLLWVRIGAPILLIILVAIDFSQAVISNDQDIMKKTISKVIRRVLAALALFFLPLFVSLMIDWIDSPYFNKDNANCIEVVK